MFVHFELTIDGVTGLDHNETSRRKIDSLFYYFMEHAISIPWCLYLNTDQSFPAYSCTGHLIALKTLWTAILRNCCIGIMLLIKCNANCTFLLMFDSSLKMWMLEGHYFSCWPESYVNSERFEPLQFWERRFIRTKLLEQKGNMNK